MKLLSFLSIALLTFNYSFASGNYDDGMFYTHNNGGRSFMVMIHNNDVDIYAKDYSIETFPESADFSLPVKFYENVSRIFIGDDKNFKDDFALGNSILIEISPLHYVFIGDFSVYEFTTTDKIEEFYSMIGNHDVPYPVAVGTDNVYFPMMGGGDGYLSRVHFQDFPKKYSWKTDAYDRLWSVTVDPESAHLKKEVKKINITKVLYKI